MEKPTIGDQLNDLQFLSYKLKMIGEYLNVMEIDEMCGEDYHHIGENIRYTAAKITEISNKIFRDPNLKTIDGGMKQAS